MSERYNLLRNLLSSGKFFKMICGAGNEDAEYVRKLSFIYTLAGANVFDISANVEVVKASMEGIDLAFKHASSKGATIAHRPFIMVSIGMPGDHHVRKSYIDPNTCIGCNLCIPVCPTDAIPQDFVGNLDVFKSLGGSLEFEDQTKEIVIKDLCIGCGKCSALCPIPGIISYRHNSRELEDLLPKCMAAGAELFELHAAVGEDETTLKEWELISRINTSNYNSMCLDRLNLGNVNLEHRIAQVNEISKDRLIIQADGYPMSGGEDDYNTTLQAVATADVINKKFNMQVNRKEKGLSGRTSNSKKYMRNSSIPIVLSGGTNSLTKELADKTGVTINGVAIGTFARDIIGAYTSNSKFYEDTSIIDQAVVRAAELVRLNIRG